MRIEHQFLLFLYTFKNLRLFSIYYIIGLESRYCLIFELFADCLIVHSPIIPRITFILALNFITQFNLPFLTINIMFFYSQLSHLQICLNLFNKVIKIVMIDESFIDSMGSDVKILKSFIFFVWFFGVNITSSIFLNIFFKN